MSVYDFSHFLNFYYNCKNWQTDNTLEFIFCSEILYVFEETYSNFKHYVKSHSVNSAIFIKHEHLQNLSV